MVFQFEHMGLDHGPGGKFDAHPLRLTGLKGTLGAWREGLADVGWNSLYWCNHDQPRAVSRLGSDDPAHRVLSHLHDSTRHRADARPVGSARLPSPTRFEPGVAHAGCARSWPLGRRSPFPRRPRSGSFLRLAAQTSDQRLPKSVVVVGSVWYLHRTPLATLFLAVPGTL